MKNCLEHVSTLLLLTVLLSSAAQASVVEGAFLGVFSGNDSEASISADLGLTVEFLARVETPATSNGDLTISDLDFNDDSEPVSGQWDYDGPEIANLFVVKAGSMYAVYRFTDALTDNMPNIGLWDTEDLGDKGMSHVSAYHHAVPLPAPMLLFASGLLALMRRRQLQR